MASERDGYSQIPEIESKVHHDVDIQYQFRGVNKGGGEGGQFPPQILSALPLAPPQFDTPPLPYIISWMSWNFVRFHEILFQADDEHFSFLYRKKILKKYDLGRSS